jgi:hypothetical protein
MRERAQAPEQAQNPSNDAGGGGPLPRMRIERGRMMHRVAPRDALWLESLCESTSGVPRAAGRLDDWSAERDAYPDCKDCPSEDT